MKLSWTYLITHSINDNVFWKEGHPPDDQNDDESESETEDI